MVTLSRCFVKFYFLRPLRRSFCFFTLQNNKNIEYIKNNIFYINFKKGGGNYIKTIE